MPFCVHCRKNLESSATKSCPYCGKAPFPTGRPPLTAAAVAFGLVGFFVAAAAVGLHLKKSTPQVPPQITATSITATATAAATASATATATPVEATLSENIFAGTWTGEPNEKGDRITLVVEDGPLPVTAHYQVTMKNGGDYRRGNLQVVANAKHPTEQIDGTANSEPYFRVGVTQGEMYGWVEVIRLTLSDKGVLKNSQPEQSEFSKLQRTGDAQPFVSPLQDYGVPEYSDAESLGSWTQQIEGVPMRTYGYTSQASLTDLHTYYEGELPEAETLYTEKADCKMEVEGEHGPVTIQIVDNDTFRRVEIYKPALNP